MVSFIFVKPILENELRNLIKDNEILKNNWDCISVYQKLSEDFIKEFQDNINWDYISEFQKLSENFIKEFQDKINWKYISKHQKLSEEFIREFQDKVNWIHISKYQKLSEDFIKEFKNKVYWYNVSAYQKLSEDFIKEFKNKVYWYNISAYQKLSEEFRKEFNLKIPETCWLYKSPEDIEKYIKEYTNYEIVNGEVIAYKSCRSDGYSTYNFQYKYEVDKEYESHADCNINNDASFGLSAWTKENAIEHCNEKLFKVAIKLEDIAAIVQDNNKIRARKIRIIKEII
jgi:hypothetical protein